MPLHFLICLERRLRVMDIQRCRVSPEGRLLERAGTGWGLYMRTLVS
jgi:hypothetical protein